MVLLTFFLTKCTNWGWRKTPKFPDLVVFAFGKMNTKAPTITQHLCYFPIKQNKTKHISQTTYMLMFCLRWANQTIIF